MLDLDKVETPRHKGALFYQSAYDGPVPPRQFIAGPKPNAPSPGRMDTRFRSEKATARSGLPSPLKSSISTLWGPPKTGTLAATVKVPDPSPGRIDRADVYAFATTRSGLSSRLRSPIVTKDGPLPTGYVSVETTPPVPSPNRIETVLS